MIVLLTGGTGTFGRAFLNAVLPLGWTVRVFSRDELKQAELREELNQGGVGANVRFLLGDVRDRERLSRACERTLLVVHAAALKRVEACEYNPGEAVRTNVEGSRNVVEAALDNRVPRSILLSSDKAVHPVNLYGATKLCAEKLWLAANQYAGARACRFSVVRYGNVVGSRGSVSERWRVGVGSVQVTDLEATRFWLTPQAAAGMAVHAAETMRGGEVFVPKLQPRLVRDLLPDGAEYALTGLQPGEKLHEQLISDEEVSRTWDCGSHYQISHAQPEGGVRVPDGFQYSSAA